MIQQVEKFILPYFTILRWTPVGLSRRYCHQKIFVRELCHVVLIHPDDLERFTPIIVVQDFRIPDARILVRILKT
jgi:hypothetical protein